MLSLPLASEYLLALMTYTTDNRKVSNSDVHAVNMRHKHDLHKPVTNLKVY